MSCNFPSTNKGDKCQTCGYCLKRDYKIAPTCEGTLTIPQSERANHVPKSKHPTFDDCTHCQGYEGSTVKHLCNGCIGGQLTTVFYCKLYDLCLPRAWAETPDTKIRRCDSCKDYQKSPD